MAAEALKERIRAFRRFNRFYTKQIGLLNQGLLHTQFPLTQARVLFELGQQRETTASRLIDETGIDAGYLSRILASFQKAGLVRVQKSRTDSRQRLLRLSASGKSAFALLDRRSSDEAAGILKELSAEQQDRLLRDMADIRGLLGEREENPPKVILRDHRPGDAGWVTQRHGVLYTQEYGWDETFEALVAEILVKFLRKHDPRRERLWIAEADGEKVGSVMLVDAGEGVSQLRLLLVEPSARGLGVGRKLIRKCIDFSRKVGYRRMKLWTQSNLYAARHLYETTGWKMTEQKPHHSFGYDLTAEIWELDLKEERSRGLRS